MTMTATPPIGTPRYLELLATAATRAQHNATPETPTADLWRLFDESWGDLRSGEGFLPEQLSYFASVGMALLCALTGRPIPHLATEATQQHLAKNAGYAGVGTADAWLNFRESLYFGVRPVTGVLVRMSDKYIRTQNLRRDAANEQVGESMADTIGDIVAYALIARCLLEEDGGLV